MVDELDDGLDGAEVVREVARRRAERRARAQERGDVGAAEPVDGLLRIADHEQAAGIGDELVPLLLARVRVARREQGREVALDRVGVLELVEEEVGVALAQAPADLPSVLGVAQHRAREHEEVVELEPATPATLVGFAQRELRDLPRQATNRRLGQRARGVRRVLTNRRHPGPDRLDVTRRRPVALLPRLRRKPREPDGQQPELLVLVGRALEPVAPPVELDQPERELVVGVPALRREHRDLAQQRDQLGSLEDRWVGLGVHPLGHEVPIGVAGERDRTQRRQGGVGVQREQQRAFEHGIVEDAVDEPRPPLLERDL